MSPGVCVGGEVVSSILCIGDKDLSEGGNCEVLPRDTSAVLSFNRIPGQRRKTVHRLERAPVPTLKRRARWAGHAKWPNRRLSCDGVLLRTPRRRQWLCSGGWEELSRSSPKGMSLNLSPVLTATGSARRMLPSIHRERPTVQDLKPNSFPLTLQVVAASRSPLWGEVSEDWDP